MANGVTKEDREKHDSAFDKHAAEYKGMTGGITGKYARHCIERMPPITSESVIHDNASGPGIATEEILAMYQGDKLPRIYGTDKAEGMIKVFKRLIEAKGWGSNVTAETMDGSDLSKILDATFTHSITTFSLWAFPDTLEGVKHIHRVLKPGGVAAITSWSHPRQIILCNQVLREVKPEQAEWQPLGKEWLDKEWILNLFTSAGFKPEDIRSEQVWDFGEFESGEKLREMSSYGFLKMVGEGWNEEDHERWYKVFWEKMTEREKQGLYDMEAFIFILRKAEDLQDVNRQDGCFQTS